MDLKKEAAIEETVKTSEETEEMEQEKKDEEKAVPSETTPLTEETK